MASVTKRPRPAAGRRGSIEAQILAATEQLLTDGFRFTDLGVQQIIETAGVARSSFYLVFKDKADLLLRLVHDVRLHLVDFAARWQPDAPGGGLPGLVSVYADMLSFYRAHAPVVAAVAEVASYDPDVQEFWNGYLEVFVELTAARISAEQAAGRTAPDFDPWLAARVAVWGGDRLMIRHVTGRPQDEDAALARELAASRWYSLYRRPSQA